ncbi:alpha-amylase family glycosyl hydrolase [Flammeovirgaceae bacterium SG7u.111]|nr:alpha-amylase family glycosyl hydrolase [Flammeovirgaceae bacterium SG7u.132]WPO38332.1 alpha-amylase family glycosyl hydrolase [Flammeovirgaceae bacterium SG7u.111]
MIFISSCEQKKGKGFYVDKTLLSNTEVCAFPDAVTYEIFPQSFADTNNDGIGDINGITQKLGYLQNLGIKAIWLMPIMPSPSYHKYDVVDYKDVHPNYGDLPTFKKMVQEAHNHDIKIIIDLIINHTSDQHPWFLESKKGKDNPYRDYYIWATKTQIDSISSMEKEATGDSDNITQWHDSEGSEEKYYGYFTGQMPDLNYDNPAVREEVINIGKFWLEEVGVDGFRMDAAKHIYEDHRVTDNVEWWKSFKASMRKIKPDVYIVGEVWDKSDFIAPFTEGLPAMFNFDMAFSILESVKREKNVSAYIEGSAWEVDENTTLTSAYLTTMAKYQAVTDDFQDAVFLSNHDQNRIMSMLDNNLEKAGLASAILLSLPGTPYIYYGEEIGMRGKKPDENIREPFLWDTKENDQFRTKWEEAIHSTDNTVDPVSVQLENSHSLLNQYIALIQLRNRSKALTSGELVEYQTKAPGLLVFIRKYEKEEVLVIHNLSEKIQNIEIPKRFENILFSSRNTSLKQGDQVQVSPYESVFVQSEK